MNLHSSNLDVLVLAGAAFIIIFGTLIAFASRYKKCPSDRILVVYGKVSSGKSAHCLHGGAAFIWPIIQDYQFLEAQRDQRIQVANANATATKGENVAAVEIANSSAERGSKEAEAERIASAAEKVATARALEEAYSSEQKAESQRAERDKATQYANIVVPAEISRDRLLVEAEAQAEQTRRMQNGAADGQRALKQAEADGLLFVRRAEAEGLKAKLLAEADGTEAILTKKAAGFRDLIETCGGPADAQNMLITEQLPNLVHEQVNAVSNLKIDKVTVWDSGRNAEGKTGTADFLSGMISVLPPLHELARNAGLDLPAYLGQLQREGEKQAKNSSAGSPESEPPAAAR